MYSKTINAAFSLVKCLPLIALPIAAQTPKQASNFEVASIRLVPQLSADEARAEFSRMAAAYRATGRLPAEKSTYPVIHGNRVDIENISKRDLLAFAYGTDPAQIEPAGSISLSWKYVIHALVPENTSATQLPEMFRTLLMDRFHLQIHRESTVRTVWALQLSKERSKLNPARELDRSACENWKRDSEFSQAEMCVFEQSNGKSKSVVTMKSASPYGAWESRSDNGVFRTEFVNITMLRLAHYLTTKLSSISYGENIQVPVIDQTGLEGEWDITLVNTSVDPMTVTTSNFADRALDTLSTALAGAGLKLSRTRAPFETLIVDRMDDRPTEN